MNLTKGDIALAYIYLLFIGGIIVVSAAISRPHVKAAEPVPEKTFTTTRPLEARAAVVYDLKEKKFLYEQNPSVQLPVASLTKLATSFLARRKAGSNDAQISVTPDSLKEEGDSGLYARETWKLSDLINLTLVSSSNDGAAAIAAAFSTTTPFVEEMNNLAAEIGLTQTYFLNPTGLDLSETTSGGYSSAADMALLMGRIVTEYPDLLEKTSDRLLEVVSEDGLPHSFKNTNSFVDSEPGLFASKTGFTDLAGGNLAVAFDVGPDRPLIAVVLGSSESARFSDISTLIESSYAYIGQTSTD